MNEDFEQEVDQDQDYYKRVSYYGNLPAPVRYSRKLSPMAKLLYVEISALTNAHGYCFASNDYLANILDMHKKSVGKLISDLSDLGFVRCEYICRDKQVVQRRIYTVQLSGDQYLLPIKNKPTTTVDKDTYQSSNSTLSIVGLTPHRSGMEYNVLHSNVLHNKEEKDIYTETAESNYEYPRQEERLLVAEQQIKYSQTAEEEPYGFVATVNTPEAQQFYNQHNLYKTNGRKEKETEVLSSAQNASDNSSAKKKKVDYTPEFEAMWLTYGNKRNKQESFIAFKKLTPEQQAQMIEFVKMYITVRAPEYRRNMDRLIEKEEYDLLYEEIERAYKAKERTTSVIINDNRAMYC